MKKRTYGQECTLAKSLDLLGERWTLLILRDLFSGPKRYKNFREGLPGIGTNLLADRLQTLSEEGLIEKVTLPPPASVEAYGLTEKGRELEPLLVQLARWGWKHGLGRDGDHDFWSPYWNPIAMKARFDPHRSPGKHLVYGLTLDGYTHRVEIGKGKIEIKNFKGENYDGWLTARGEDFHSFLKGKKSLAELLESQSTSLEGSKELLKDFLGYFG